MKKKASQEQHYCDSCIFIGFLSQEPDKFQRCKNIIEAAESNYITLYKSTFTMAEVVKIKVNTLSETQQEKIIQSLFSNLWINLVAFERETAEISRYLVRKYKLKPFDSLHLATAIRMQVDYFNTTDTKMIKKLPQTVSYLPNYPKEVMIQEPFIRGYQPRLF